MPMIDDWLLSLIYAAWLAASTMPLGFMLGSSCSPCCGQQGCEVADGKPRTDPANEGTWTPSGTWLGAGGVTWTFTANPGDDSGETWFFYGSASTSRVGGGATTAQQQDWGNICNWYSSKTTSPSLDSGLPGIFNKRATRLPPTTAVVHVYTSVTTSSAGPQTVKNIYFWNSDRFARNCFLLSGSEVTTTASAHDSNGGAVFAQESANVGVVNNGATFDGESNNSGTVNGGAVFNGVSGFFATNASDGVVNDGAIFNGDTQNQGVVNDGAVFNDNARNVIATVNGGATFNNNSENRSLSVVNNGAVFNDNSENDDSSTVNGGATFNDAACSFRAIGAFGPPCTRKFVAHPTDLPTCNGTARAACDGPPFAGCGCG